MSSDFSSFFDPNRIIDQLLKYLISFSFTFMFILLVTDTWAQPNIGIYAGSNNLNISGDTPSKSKFKSSGGYLFGISGDFKITDEVFLSFQPGIISSNVELQFKDPSTNLYEDSVSFNFNYFQLPVEINIISNNKRFYFSSGLEFSNLLKAETTISSNTEDISEEVNKFNLFINYGLTYLIPIGKPFLFIDARYAQGITNMTNTPDDQSLIPRIKLSGWKFRAGIQIPLKKTE